MKTRTMIALVAGAAMLSSTAMADGFRVNVGYSSGHHGGYYGGQTHYVNSYRSCGTPVYTRGYVQPYYAPTRTVVYTAPRYSTYRSHHYPRVRSHSYGYSRGYRSAPTYYRSSYRGSSCYRR